MAKKTNSANNKNTTVGETAVATQVTGEAVKESAEETAVFDEPAPEPVVEEESNKEDIVAVLSDIKEISGSTSSDDNVEVRVAKSKFGLTDKIPCKSLFHGKLVYTSPTNGARWIWKECGAIEKIPLGELETMNNHKPKFLTDPLIVILEPSVVEDFNFGDTYRKIASLTKLGAMFATGTLEQIRKAVRELLEVGMRESVIAEARKHRKDDTLNNINIINMLNSELKTDIM